MTETRNWLELPSELTANILHRLGAVEILQTAQKVCTAWRKICKDPAMWRIVDMSNLGGLHAMRHDLEIMCRHAVDRSEGLLIDINIEYFGTVALLDYIVERSSQLRRLQISCGYRSFYGELGKVVKNLLLLEELSLNLTEISEEDIKIVGRSCPQLKSLKLNAKWNKPSDSSELVLDSAALAIAESMPRLLHLQLIGNQMTDKGLKAILDGCKRLESLDLRLCNNLKFEGSLGKRCSEQIKDLKRPNDSLKGCRFTFRAPVDERVNVHGGRFVLPYHYGDHAHYDDDSDDDDDDDDVNDGDHAHDDDDDDDEEEEDDDDDDDEEEDDDDHYGDHIDDDDINHDGNDGGGGGGDDDDDDDDDDGGDGDDVTADDDNDNSGSGDGDSNGDGDGDGNDDGNGDSQYDDFNDSGDSQYDYLDNMGNSGYDDFDDMGDSGYDDFDNMGDSYDDYYGRF